MLKNLIITIGTFFLTNVIVAQSISSKKPEYLLIVNNEVVTKETVNQLSKKGLIKSMNKGVSEEFRSNLIQKLKKEIVEKEFIIQFELYTEEELKNKPKTKASSSKKQQTTNNGYKVKLHQKAPDFVVQMLNNETITLSELKGKVVLLNFWATWCAPCLREFYDIQPQILEPLKNKPFVFIPISIGERKETVVHKMNQLKKDGINFNVGTDLHNEIWNKYANSTLPKSVLIDQEGNIQLLVSGGSEENIQLLKNKIIKLINNQ